MHNVRVPALRMGLLRSSVATIALLGSGCGGSAPLSPSGPPVPAGNHAPFQLRVDRASASRLSVPFSQPLAVIYSPCFSIFPVTRGATIRMDVAVFGPAGDQYSTTPLASETRDLAPGRSYGGCGGTSVLDHDLTHPVASRYRLSVRYTESDGTTGVVEGEAGVDWIVRTPAVAPGVVINEFTTDGRNGERDQWVELKNLSSTPVVMNRWRIIVSDNRGHTGNYSISLPPSVTLPPGCHLLLTSERPIGGYTGTVPGEPLVSFLGPIPRDGGMALFNERNEAVDQVALSYGSLYREGTPLQPLAPTPEHTYERQGRDTDNNAADFVLRGEGTPQNLSMCR